MGISGWVLRHSFRLYERFKAQGTPPPDGTPDGLPVPPADLRVQVAGTADIGSFMYGGQLAAQTVRDLLAAAGRPVEQCGALLDFGCGCGRVLRHWREAAATTLYGTDFSPDLVQWCKEQLPFASVSLNSLEPPLSFSDECFDAIYAFSVFTHMPADIQRAWLREFRRVLQPRGLLIFSTHGSYYTSRLGGDDQQKFFNGELVVRFAAAAGSNLCNAYHPEAFVRRELAPGWEIVAFAPEGALGNPRQDAWVFRRL